MLKDYEIPQALHNAIKNAKTPIKRCDAIVQVLTDAGIEVNADDMDTLAKTINYLFFSAKREGREQLKTEIGAL